MTLTEITEQLKENGKTKEERIKILRKNRAQLLDEIHGSAHEYMVISEQPLTISVVLILVGPEGITSSLSPVLLNADAPNVLMPSGSLTYLRLGLDENAYVPIDVQADGTTIESILQFAKA